jgi:hypothetical protein
VAANFSDSIQSITLPYKVLGQNKLDHAGDNQISNNSDFNNYTNNNINNKNNVTITLAPLGAVVVAVE